MCLRAINCMASELLSILTYYSTFNLIDSLNLNLNTE